LYHDPKICLRTTRKFLSFLSPWHDNQKIWAK
jgi:hypothetical protein